MIIFLAFSVLSHSVELEKRILTVHTSPLDTHREKFLPKPISLDGPVVRKFDFKSPGCQFESGLNPEKGQGKQRNFSNRKSVCICRQLESENTSGVQIYSCIKSGLFPSIKYQCTPSHAHEQVVKLAPSWWRD